MAIILGVLAVLALMGSPDGESAWKAAETSIKESESMGLVDAAQKLTNSKVDSETTWNDMLKKANEEVEATGIIKSAHDAQLQEDEAARKAQRDTEAKVAEQKHQDHHDLRQHVGKTTTHTVAKELGAMVENVSSAAAKAAAQAAHKVIQKKKDIMFEEEAERNRALKDQAKTQKFLDNIQNSQEKLTRIQAERKEREQRDTEKANAFAKSVQEHVEQASRHFRNMHVMLKHLKEKHATLKVEAKELTAMQKTSEDYTQKMAELQETVDRTDKANVKEKAEKDKEERAFKKKEGNIVGKMSTLIDKMKKAIKTTAIRKATPHPDAQKHLNDLNAKAQLYAETISTLSTKIDCLKKELKVAKKLESVLEFKKDKRRRVLKLAKDTAAKLKHSVETLTNIVKTKDDTVKIHQSSGAGVDFAKKLASSLDLKLSNTAKQVANEAAAHAKQRLLHLQHKAEKNPSFLTELEVATEPMP